jgi:thiol-disulfide isomerase/thioredoxin
MKKIALFSTAFLLLVGAGLLVVIKNDKDTPAEQSVAQTNESATSQETTDSVNKPVAAPGTYVTYSEDALTNAQGTRLLFFYAPWCPQCRALEADIQSQALPENTTILKVDYDSNQALRRKYGVTIQTTIVRVDENGSLVKKYVAYDEPTLASVIKNVL